MHLKPKDRQLIKNCLLITNMLLAVVLLLGLLFVGMLIIRPKLIDRATNVGQFLSLDLNHLPQSLDTIEPDYLGKQNKQNLAPGQFEQVSHEREVITEFSNSFLQGSQMKGYEIYLYLPLYESNNLKSLEKNLLNPNFGVEEILCD